MKALIIATRNAHKVFEIQSILSDRCRCRGVDELGADVPDALEDQDSFSGNAIKKALTIAAWLKSVPDLLAQLGGEGEVGVIADDSGLEVDALKGAPGIHSARFAALDDPVRSGNSLDSENNAKLLRLLQDVSLERRAARFRCAVAWVPRLDGPTLTSPRIFEGTCEGVIALAPSGGGGFGYDPLFLPIGQSLSFAQLGSEFKNQMSHRAKALRLFRALF